MMWSSGHGMVTGMARLASHGISHWHGMFFGHDIIL